MKDSKIATLEAQRVSLFHKLQSLSIEELNYQPAPGKWSILQIITHIVISEEKSVQYVIKKTQYPEVLKPISLNSRILSAIMNLYLTLNLKAKAPSLLSPNSDDGFRLIDLENRWTNTRMELENVSKLSPNILNKGIYKHPRVGYMNFEQMLSFFGSHYGHHLKQVSTIVDMRKEFTQAVAL